jgi:hypothetical protein
MLRKVLSRIGNYFDILPYLASKLKKCCEIRAISMVGLPEKGKTIALQLVSAAQSW